MALGIAGQPANQCQRADPADAPHGRRAALPEASKTAYYRSHPGAAARLRHFEDHLASSPFGSPAEPGWKHAPFFQRLKAKLRAWSEPPDLVCKAAGRRDRDSWPCINRLLPISGAAHWLRHGSWQTSCNSSPHRTLGLLSWQQISPLPQAICRARPDSANRRWPCLVRQFGGAGMRADIDRQRGPGQLATSGHDTQPGSR